MVIMAGGQGLRLRPHTNLCPKPLLTVNGAPILEHIVRRAKKCGFSRFVISLGYLGHMIQEHFGDGSSWNVEISYITEEKPLGTAGALGLLNLVPADPFIVINGDILTGIDYGAMLDQHLKNGAIATMAVREYVTQIPFGVVVSRDHYFEYVVEKPVSKNYINAGIYVIEPGMLYWLGAGGYCDMPELFTRSRQAGQNVMVYPLNESWADLGTPADIGMSIKPGYPIWHDAEVGT